MNILFIYMRNSSQFCLLLYGSNEFIPNLTVLSIIKNDILFSLYCMNQIAVSYPIQQNDFFFESVDIMY